MTTTSKSRGFTLVEMLVVIAIIAILSGLLLVGVTAGLGAARRTANAVEIANLVGAIEMYKSANGNLYPPSFNEALPAGYANYAAVYNNGAGPWRNTVLGRYLLKAYPKISDRDVAYMFQNLAGNLDQCSALPFWLNQTSADPRYPFTSQEKRSYYNMDERRLTAGTLVSPGGNLPATQLYLFRPPHAGESYYIYIEARHYPSHVRGDANSLDDPQNAGTTRIAAGTGAAPRSPEFSVRPFLRQAVQNDNPNNLRNYINSDSFQLFCAGLDGRYSVDHNQLRKFPGGDTGLNFAGAALTPAEYADDLDNQTNFSDGARLGDVAAQ